MSNNQQKTTFKKREPGVSAEQLMIENHIRINEHKVQPLDFSKTDDEKQVLKDVKSTYQKQMQAKFPGWRKKMQFRTMYKGQFFEQHLTLN
tara:strand:+ start:379 stop:651 length:273 start_codon:yes stop_codon:yes gene_type:complete